MLGAMQLSAAPISSGTARRLSSSSGRAAAAAATTAAPRRGVAWRHSVRAQAEPAKSTPQQQDAASLDVSGAVVSAAYRSTPWAAEREAAAAGAARAPARIAFVSESGVCRCLLAAAAFQRLLEQRGQAGQVEVGCRATRDFCVGEGPDASVAAVAAELGWQLPASYRVQQFKEAVDIVDFDVVLVMDKFTAADVLREVSVFDTITSWGKANYSSKVRRLGEFHPEVAAAPGSGPGANPDAADIEDALYGNVGGEEELAAVRQVAARIQQSCEGLADFVATVQQQHRQQQQQQAAAGGTEAAAGSTSTSSTTGGSGSGSRLGDSLLAAVRDMEAMEWLVPPMLQPR